MGVLKSKFGLVLCAVYIAIAALALIHDLTKKPGVVLIFDEALPLVTMPGLIILAVPLELMGVKANSGEHRTPLLIAAALVTAALMYLIGAGAEALYKSVSK